MAGGAAVGAILGTPLGWSIAAKVGGTAAKMIGYPVAAVAGVGLGTVGLGAYGLVGTATGRRLGMTVARRGLRTGYHIGATIAGGTAYGAYKTASWIYRNPGLTTIGAGVAGGVLAARQDPPPTTRGFTSGMVDTMGGSSNYGVQEMMANMNATGDIVLGANRRR
jgi:hypothetical protein